MAYMAHSSSDLLVSAMDEQRTTESVGFATRLVNVYKKLQRRTVGCMPSCEDFLTISTFHLHLPFHTFRTGALINLVGTTCLEFRPEKSKILSNTTSNISHITNAFSTAQVI